jgi:hypothetical protein
MPTSGNERTAKLPPSGTPSIKLDLSKIGTTGLPVWSGRVYDELIDELSGERGRRVLREMSEQDPIISGILLGVELLSRQVAWALKPSDESDEAKEIADFVDDCFSDMYPTWENTMSEILSFLTYGWSYLEIIYKKRDGIKIDDPRASSKYEDGKIAWAGWSIRSQETLWSWLWSEGNKGEMTGMNQLAPPDFVLTTIPRHKALHFTTRSRRENPEGFSLLRGCYRSWYMKKNIEVIEGIGVERDLAGLPVMWAPPDLFSPTASDDEKALFELLRKTVTAIKRDEQEGILMPMQYDDEGKNPLYKLELLSTGGDRQFDTTAIISRYDERIAMSMLADFILMGHQAVGSYALSTTKTGLFSTALSAFLDLIAAEINARAIPRLVLLNGWDLSLCPTLQHGKIDTTDMAKLSEFLMNLFKSGMTLFPNDKLQKYLLELAGLPSDPMEQYVQSEDVGDLADIDEPGAQGQLQPVTPPLPGQAGVVGRPPGQQPTGAAGGPNPSAGNNNGIPGAMPSRGATGQQPWVQARRRVTPQQIAALAGTVPHKAHEAKVHHRHFITLTARVASLRHKLMAQLSDEEYGRLLAAVMEAGTFSKLPGEFQALIRQAEV